ncbi:folate receptor family-domain-containing protein [Pelagophyceae sp. CCMP2097]|nr:folate receptor family-domain-containing protein [Pelagophyceae sp. CCMP2097]
MFKSILLLSASAVAQDLSCKPFKDIYADGKELCEVMWNNAFKYETAEEKAYTMWFFDAGANPNHAVSKALGLPDQGMCELEYFHKAGPPTQENDDFTECHPWKDSSCCHQATVASHDSMREAYGPAYEWDRCGTLSQACERFFVQEQCMYECEVNTAPYRRCTDEQADNGVILDAGLDTETDCTDNKWQIWEMPVKASYCDAWFDACRHDSFCGGGDYFECALLQTEAPSSAPPSGKKSKEDVIPMSIVGVVAGLCALAVLLCGCFVFVVSKEKSGKPLFAPMVQDDVKNGLATEMM